MTTRKKKTIVAKGQTAKRKTKVATIAAAAEKPKVKEKKEQITLRLDKDVIDHFRAIGDGYQAKMSGYLGAAMVDAQVRALTNERDVPWYEEHRYHPMMIDPVFRPKKEQITLRVDADTMAYFRHIGKGYQSEMNRVLRLIMIDRITDRATGGTTPVSTCR